MSEMKRTTLGILAAILFLVALGAPSTAMAGLKQATVSWEFDSSLSSDERVAFVDERFDEYDDDDIDGYVAAHKRWGVMVIEASESTIDSELGDLTNDSRLSEVEVLDQVYPDTPTFGSLGTDTELDVRNTASAAKDADTYKRSYVRARFTSGLSSSEKVSWHDEHFSDFTDAGLGGLFVNGHGHDFITIEIEGKPSKVDYWLQQLADDPNLATMTVLQSEYPDQATFDDLVGHVPSDERENNK
jgi:hypothetical protein